MKMRDLEKKLMIIIPSENSSDNNMDIDEYQNRKINKKASYDISLKYKVVLYYDEVKDIKTVCDKYEVDDASVRD